MLELRKIIRKKSNTQKRGQENKERNVTVKKKKRTGKRKEGKKRTIKAKESKKKEEKKGKQNMQG